MNEGRFNYKKLLLKSKTIKSNNKIVTSKEWKQLWRIIIIRKEINLNNKILIIIIN